MPAWTDVQSSARRAEGLHPRGGRAGGVALQARRGRAIMASLEMEGGRRAWVCEEARLDNVVEDIELEVAAIYAAKLGFKSYIVGELFKAIATAPFDGKSTSEVRKEVEGFLAMYDS